MRINLIYELSMILNSDDFQVIFDTMYDRSDCIIEYEDGYIDHSLETKGIAVRFRNSTYKKKISIIVNAAVLLDSDSINSEKIVSKLEKRIAGYFNNDYTLDDFELSGVSVFTDINVGSRDNVSAYIKVLKRIGKVKGFTPISYERIKDSTGYCLEGNSNGIGFLMYDLEDWLADNLSGDKIKQVKGIIRAEVKLTKKKTISDFTGENKTIQRIRAITDNSRGIFAKVFSHIVPFGDFYKMDEAVEIIRNRVIDSKVKRRMLALVKLIPEKKSLLLAQKTLNYRRFDKVMMEFAETGVSPVTINKKCAATEITTHRKIHSSVVATQLFLT